MFNLQLNTTGEPQATGPASNVWDNPQARIDMKPYSILRKLDPEEQDTLNALLKAPTIEVNYDLNDDEDYAVAFQTEKGVKVARISGCSPTINGVRWNLVPGKNVIPLPVYEFLLTVPEQKRLLSCPTPGRAQNILPEPLRRI